MIKIYDKARWHIDAGMDTNYVVNKMKILFDFLNANNLLEYEGKEMFEIGIDSSISIHERMLTVQGNKFMDEKYDGVINSNLDEFAKRLEKAFVDFQWII